MRKIFVILLIITAIIAAGASMWVLLKKPDEPYMNTLYDAIPLDAGLILDVRDHGELNRVLHESDLWNDLGKISFIQTLNDEMMLLDSIVQNNEILPVNVVFSFHPVGKDEMQSIGYAAIGSDREVRALMEELKAKAIITQQRYDNVEINNVAFDDENLQSLNFSCAYRSGILIFSRSSILLEYAIRQTVADSKITDNENLTELMRTAGKNTPANIYVNYSLLPRTALTVLHERHSNILEPLTLFADWTGLDVNIRPDALLFNGFTECDNDSNRWFETLLPQPSIPVTLIDAIPATAYTFLWLGIRNLEKYFADYSLYLDENRKSARKRELDRLESSFRIDLQKEFAELFEDELALVYANVGQPQSHSEPFAIFRVKSASSAESMIEVWQDAARQGVNDNSDKSAFTLDDNLRLTAYRLPFDVPGTLFGDIFAGGNQWCVVADNYLVFGNSSANLQRYLQHTIAQSNLQTNIEYGRLSNLISARSNLMFYSNPANMEDFLRNTLKPDIFREISSSLSQMQAVVYQLNSTGGKLYNNLFLKGLTPTTPTVSNDYAPTSATAPTTTTGTQTTMQTSWESLLDAAVSYKPQLVRNHSTNEIDIFVQDANNNIYLINNVGRILWKVNIPEQIISPVYQIDIYRNGRLQMFFNTKNYLYVVDRLGNFVDRFPVRLPSPAVGSVSLFDYDNNRQYRMMIACEDRRVYLYDRTGRQVDGWSFRQTESAVQTDLYHFRTGNRDYIVFADRNRVYVLDRQGRTRVTPESALPVGNQTTIALDARNSRLVLTDTLGTVHFIALSNGRMTQQRIKTFPATHFFAFQDVDGDGQGEFIFAADNKLEVFRQDGRQIIDIEARESITLRPQVYEFAANDKRVGIVQPQSNQIWLYDARGNVSAGFPLRGNSLFTIGRLDLSSRNFNLFVGSSNNFLYNYSVGR